MSEDERIARRYCELRGIDADERLDVDIGGFWGNRRRWEIVVEQVRSERAMMQAIGESLLDKLDALLR